MKPFAALLAAFFCVALICCRREIPDPPLTDQSHGFPAGTGPCEVSFYSLNTGRVYTLTVDGIYHGSMNGTLFAPSCGAAGTATFHLDAGSHTVAYSWVQGSSTGSGAFSFTLAGGNCQLEQL